MMSSWVSLCLVLCLASSAAGQPNLVPKTTYLVKVTTGNMGLDPEPAAGDQVFIKLSGEKNVTDFKELRKDGNAFKNGSEAEFTITAKDVGNITAITIKKTATSLPKEDWRLRQVVIEDSKGTIYEFSCMCWISKAKGLEKTLKPCKVIPPTVSSTQAKPTSPSSSSSASPSASGSPTSGSTATPTNREGTSEPTVASGATSAKPSASPGEATSPTSSKPSGSASSPSPSSNSSGPTSKTSASPSPTSEASSGSSTQPSSTSGSSTQPTSSPTSNPSSSGASPSGSVASKPTEPSSKPTASNAKVTSSTGAKSSNPTSKPTAPTKEQPGSASSVKPSGKPSKQPSSVAPTSESGSTTAPTSMPTSGPTSEASTAAIGTKPSGPSSKPTAPTSKKPSTPSKAKTSSPGSSGKPPGAASTKPSATISTKPSGPASSAKPSGPSSIATPSGPASSAKPSGPSSIATPSGPSSSAKPSGPSSIATPSGPSSSAKPSGPSSSAKPSGPSSIATPSGPSSSAKPSGPSSSAKPSAPKSAKPSGPAISTTAKPSGSPSTKPSGFSSSTTSGSSPSGASPTRSTAVTSPGNSSSVPTTRPTPSQPHAAFINGLLHEMNVMRLLHGVGPFLLEKNMSQVAQKKAGKSIKRGSIEDETENTYGMTTCKLEGTPQEDAAKKCVSKWYATVKDFDWSNPRVKPKTSQFSQLVWKATTHVGIGVAGKNVVVYFDPPSNEMESAKDNVPPVTELSDGTFHVCPEGFRLSGSSCFKFNAAPSTWAKAIETCAHHGATIASLQSQEENTFINGMISGLQNSDTSETWIGFNDRITESSYQWVDGSVVKFHQFLQTEPTGIGENCVALKNTKNETGWEDKKCTDILPSLCRRPAEGPITYKITFLIEIVIQNPSSKKTVIPPPGGKDRATLIKEKLNSTSSKKPIEFVGESTETGPDGASYYSVIVKVPPGTTPDIVQPLQNYLDNHNNHIYPGSKEKVFIASVTVNNPANGMCYSTCFTTCSNQCSPMCCSATYIINPSTQSQAPPYQPRYNYANGYQYPAASSYSSSYLPGYPYSSPSAQQNSLSMTNPYMSRNIMGCARACTRISRNDFCPPYCPKRCCRARSFQPRFFARPRFYSLKK